MRPVRFLFAAVIAASLWTGCGREYEVQSLGTVSPLALEVCCSDAPQIVPDGFSVRINNALDPDLGVGASFTDIHGAIKVLREDGTEVRPGDSVDSQNGFSARYTVVAESCDFEQATIVVRFSALFEYPLFGYFTQTARYEITVTNTCYDPAAAPPPEPPPPPMQPSLVFASDRDGDLEIYLGEPDGSGAIQLTDNDWEDFDPVLSPDSTEIAYLSNEHAPAIPAYEIYVMNRNGTNRRRMTEMAAPGEVYVADPAWSPGGLEIAFTVGGLGAAGIYVLNLATDDVEQYTFLPGDRTPTWRDNGLVLAFERDGDLYHVPANLNNLDVQPLLEGPNDDRTPAWSPDGTQIAFERDGDLYVTDTAGFAVEALIQTAGTVETGPAWSPDGTKIVYERVSVLGESEIRVLDLATRSEAPLEPGQQPDWGR